VVKFHNGYSETELASFRALAGKLISTRSGDSFGVSGVPTSQQSRTRSYSKADNTDAALVTPSWQIGVMVAGSVVLVFLIMACFQFFAIN